MDPNQLGTNKTKQNKYLIQLHEQSLQWLMKIGPKYPQVKTSYLIEFFDG